MYIGPNGVVMPLKISAINPSAPPSIRAAVERLAPRDELDDKVRRGGQLLTEEQTEVQLRRSRVQFKCLQLAATVDEKAAAKFLNVAAWLEKPPTPGAVDEHMLRVGILVQVTVPASNPRAKPEIVMRPELVHPAPITAAGAKASHAALLAFKDSVPSACGARLYDIAMGLARHSETRQRVPSGSSHGLLVNLIDAPPPSSP